MKLKYKGIDRTRTDEGKEVKLSSIAANSKNSNIFIIAGIICIVVVGIILFMYGIPKEDGKIDFGSFACEGGVIIIFLFIAGICFYQGKYVRDPSCKKKKDIYKRY